MSAVRPHHAGGSALAASLVSCHQCALLSRLAPTRPGHVAHCPRCDAPLHARKPASLSRTFALLIAAAILYVPANLLPVSTIVSLGKAKPDTILSGVRALFVSGDAPIAVLLFFASICVPVLKLLALTWLCLSVHYRWRWRLRDRTMLYRLVETIGRWSMLDVFVISILVALVRMDAIAGIEAGAGAVCFAVVVVLTMFAARSFDPRLMWDALETER
ncbi:MAG: paraquat-inducible protein A [Planctomycetota bacterium]|jgi:paraquat-inducible protein A